MRIRDLIVRFWILSLINVLYVLAKSTVCDEKNCYATTGEVCNGRGVCACGQCACHTGYSGQTCEQCDMCTSPCGFFKDCVSCKIFGTGHLGVFECLNRCDLAIYLPVETKKFDEVGDDLIKCSHVNSKLCVESFKLGRMNGGYINVFVRKEMECSKEQENATILLNPPQRSHEVNNDKIISHTTENNADNTNHTGEFTNDKFSKNEHNENDDDDDDNSSETEESNDEEGDEKDDDDDKHDSSEKEEQEELKETNILLLPTKSSQTFSLSITEHVNSSASSDTQSDGTVNLDKTAVKTSETEEISVTIDTNVNLENVNYTVVDNNAENVTLNI
ncbi:hypothetical protein DPMN_177314 [Dreissena polymorpha]|uniref:Integrin beta subunit tail domain-containing protein n=1 Tax=Dreissena polymorpha TaxID=45954 RepID=A0A9D4EBH1_DREPO|nr:hypothetical protein DPMN_177314 [Dreissena polymorpha]